MMAREDEILRAAATLIEQGGWAHGEPGSAVVRVDAWDSSGRPVDLMVTGSSETGRAAPNPAAVSFSLYGAIATAMYHARLLGGTGRMWPVVTDRASERNAVAHGGTNFVHPIVQFNETEGRTVEEVLAFLGACADELAPADLPEVQEVKAAQVAIGAPLRPDMMLPAPKTDRVALGPHPAFDDGD